MWGLTIPRDWSTSCNELHRSIALQCDIHLKWANAMAEAGYGETLNRPRYPCGDKFDRFPGLFPTFHGPYLSFVTSYPAELANSNVSSCSFARKKPLAAKDVSFVDPQATSELFRSPFKHDMA